MANPRFEGFTDQDFRDTVEGTHWRGRDRLGGVLTALLQERTSRAFQSWAISRRRDVFVAPPDHFGGTADAVHGLPRCKLLVRTTKSELLYGFYIEKGYGDSSYADASTEVMDASWDWLRFADALKGPLSGELRALLNDPAYRIRCDIRQAGAFEEVVLYIGQGALLSRTNGRDSQPTNWESFLARILAAGDDTWVDFYLEQVRTPQQAVDRGEAIAADIVEAFVELVPIFDASTSTGAREHKDLEVLAVRERTTEMRSERLTVEQLADYFRMQAGLNFTPYQVAAYFTALQTKGFVILSGLSGTGKTKLAQHFAKLLNPEGDGDNYLFVPVRPDWRENTALIGYYNPLLERYESTDLLRFISEAYTQITATKSSGLEKWLRARLQQPDKMQEAQDFRNVNRDLAKRQSAELSSDQLNRLWRMRDNGIAGIGQAIAARLPDDETLRQATQIVMNTQRPVGERYIDAVQVLGKPKQWARTWRAIAAFDPSHAHTIVHGGRVKELLKALEYSNPIDPRHAAENGDADAVTQATDFLLAEVDRVAPGLDFFERSNALWELWEYYCGGVDRASVRAAEDPASVLPYFILLDEMNLAHVEHYFADFLSVLESGRRADGTSQELVRLHNFEDGKLDATGSSIPMTLRLPPNLYFIGTVNVDETTHSFSPKVLDRAFTIEFDAADLTGYPPLPAPGEGTVLPGEALQLLLQSFTRQGEFARIDKFALAAFDRRHPEFMARLRELEALLRPHELHFAYRTVDEILMYLVNAESYGWFDSLGGLQAAFDSAVLMKVLPKFHGPRARLRNPLLALLRWAGTPEDIMAHIDNARYNEALVFMRVWLLAPNPDFQQFPCPRVALKCVRMVYQLHTTGFAAFS